MTPPPFPVFAVLNVELSNNPVCLLQPSTKYHLTLRDANRFDFDPPKTPLRQAFTPLVWFDVHNGEQLIGPLSAEVRKFLGCFAGVR